MILELILKIWKYKNRKKENLEEEGGDCYIMY